MDTVSYTTLIKEIIERLDQLNIIVTNIGGSIAVILIILTIILACKGDSKDIKYRKLEQQQKIINELQNITSRQQEFLNKLRDTNDLIFRQTDVLKAIQKQTRTESQEEKEEIKKRIEELNKMMKV